MAGSDGTSSNSQHGYKSTDYLLENYKLGRNLGSGSFGKVKQAEHILTGQKVAIKILNRRKIASMDMEEKVRREIKISALFNHPHIIRLYEVIKTSADIFVVMEYVEGGELFDYIVEKGRLQEDEARQFFQQIISGLEYCHRNMVVHRDLKPENLLLESKVHIKLADFGLSNVMRDGHFLKTSCGSPNYAAPEVISGKLYAGPEVDVWSCGVILYALLCGLLPFDDENIPNLYRKIKKGMYTLPSHLSQGARDLIPRMLVVDPLKRITIAEIRQHPWFTTCLPRYLAVMQVEPVASIRIDKDAMQRCIAHGFNQQELVAALKARRTTKATVTYYLEVDNKAKTAKNDYLMTEMGEASQAKLQHPSGIMTAQSPDGSGRQPSQPQKLSTERNWRLGFRTNKRPQHIYADLHAAFVSLNVLWKRNGPYNFRCRAHVPASASQQQSSHDSDTREDEMSTELSKGSCAKVIRFEVQVYRVRTHQYLVDLQRIEGHLYVYLDICSELLCFLANRGHSSPHLSG